MEEKAKDLLQGKILQIYWFLLTHGECGVREVQTGLKISSPSTVAYNITKLVDEGLVSQSSTGKYFIEERVKSGILGLYIKIGKRMIPRIIFYFSFFTIGTIFYIFYVLNRSGGAIFIEDFVFLFFSISAMVFFIYEAYRIWSLKPI